MIYLDSSVVLAILFGERRQPLPDLFEEVLVSSQLLEFECFNRAHARQVDGDGLDWLGNLLQRITLIDMARETIERALLPFPRTVRTLDAIHLATAVHLQHEPNEVQVATYDRRLADACAAMDLSLYPLVQPS